MSGDILPMSPVSATRLVQEKRHYPGQHKEQSPKDDKESEKDSTGDAQLMNEQSTAEQKNVNAQGKNVKVGHIDEYA
jgi:hypothetical protein